MLNLITRDLCIGFREISPVIKWTLLLAVFLSAASLIIEPLAPNIQEQGSKPAYGVCCDGTEIHIDKMRQLSYESKELMIHDLTESLINASILIHEDKATIQTLDNETTEIISNSINSYIHSNLGDIEISKVETEDSQLLTNAIWIFVCLISLVPIALSEALIGLDFRSGRLSEVVAASARPLEVITSKIVAIWSLSVLVTTGIVVTAGSAFVVATSYLISNDETKLEAINTATNNEIALGNQREVLSILISFINESGVMLLLAGAVIITLQISTTLMLINLFVTKGISAKSFVEKLVALLVWLPLLMPINSPIVEFLPIYSIYEIALNIGSNTSLETQLIAINCMYLVVGILIVITATCFKKEWPTTN